MMRSSVCSVEKNCSSSPQNVSVKSEDMSPGQPEKKQESDPKLSESPMVYKASEVATSSKFDSVTEPISSEQIPVSKGSDGALSSASDTFKPRRSISEGMETIDQQIWCYTMDDKQQGPVSEAALQRMAQEGSLSIKTTVWDDSMRDKLSIHATKFSKFLPKNQRMSYLPAFFVVVFFILGELAMGTVTYLQPLPLNSKDTVYFLSILFFIAQTVAWMIDLNRLTDVTEERPWMKLGILNIVLMIMYIVIFSVFHQVYWYLNIITLNLLKISFLIGPTVYIFKREKFTYKKRWGSNLIVIYDIIMGDILCLAYYNVSIKRSWDKN